MPLAALHREGSADLIVCLHGLGCVKENFGCLWDEARLGRAALWAPDLPGCGRSAHLPPDACTMEAMADAVAADIEQIGQGARVHLVLHSMGGAVGLLVAQRLTDRLGAVINVEGNLVADDCGLLSRRTAGFSLEEFASGRFDRLKARASQSDDPMVRAWANWMNDWSPEGFHTAAHSLVEWSDGAGLLDIYLSLPVPTLYVYGEKSANPDVLKHLDAVPKRRIDGCGHFPMVEAPAQFARIVGDMVTAA